MIISPELYVINISLIVILCAYILIYPRTAKSNGIKIAIYDIGFSMLTVVISGFIFWNTNVSFDLYVIKVNWFFFTFLSYGLLEIPFMLWYFHKHKVWESF